MPVVVGGILRIFWLIRNIIILTISAVPVFAVFKFSIRIIEKTEHSPGKRDYPLSRENKASLLSLSGLWCIRGSPILSLQSKS